MRFYGKEHRALISRLEASWADLQNLTELAEEFGINDIFQDNGAKTLQQLIYLNMKLLPGREGNDCVSSSGTEWEMKSINLDTPLMRIILLTLIPSARENLKLFSRNLNVFPAHHSIVAVSGRLF